MKKIHIVQTRDRARVDQFQDTYHCSHLSKAIQCARWHCKNYNVAKMDVRVIEVTYREVSLPPFITKADGTKHRPRARNGK